MKPDGSVREIYNVRKPLKHLLKRVNSRFFRRCVFPDYLTGSLPGWSYEKNAAIHTAQGTVITIDATNFFPSISQAQVKDIWLNFFRFAEPVAEALARLCCYKGFLVQGGPPSSFLANLLFYDLEPLIVKELRANGYRYSRYVDDICVSHKRTLTDNQKSWTIKTAKKVFLSKGLTVKPSKTKVMDRSTRQEVNKRTVNAGRVCASKELKYELRASIHRFAKQLESLEPLDAPFERKVSSLEGKIRHFRKFNTSAADKMLADLRDICQGAPPVYKSGAGTNQA